MYVWLLLALVPVLSPYVPVEDAAAGLRWLDCEATPVLPPEVLPEDAGPLDTDVWADAAVLRPAVLSFLTDGVVLTTEDLAAVEDVEVTVLPGEVLPEDTLPDDCARVAVLLPVVLLLLLTVRLVPMPPLRVEPLPNSLSDPVSCRWPYHTSRWSGPPPICPGPWPGWW